MSDSRPPRVRSVEVLEGFLVKIAFTDDSERRLDLLPFLRGPIFDEIREDAARFRELHVDPELGTIVWPNGADIDPDVLYGSETPEGQGDLRAS